MKKIKGRKLLWIAIATMLITSVYMIEANTSSPTELSVVSVMDETYVPGSTVVIDIAITDVTDLYGFTIKLRYDPLIVYLDDIQVGSFFPDYFIWKKVMGVDYVWFVVTRALGMEGGITGSGTIAQAYLTVLSVGVSPMDLFDTDLRDSFANPIAHDVFDGAFSNTADIYVSLRTGFVENRHWCLSNDPEGKITLTGKIKNIGSGITQAKAVFIIFDESGGYVGTIESPMAHISPNEILDLSADFTPSVPMRYSAEVQVFFINPSGMPVTGLKGSDEAHRTSKTLSFFAQP